MTARADAIPAGEAPSDMLALYLAREAIHAHGETCPDDEYERIAIDLDQAEALIVNPAPTSVAELAAQMLTVTEHGEHYLTADMIDRLRALIAESMQ